MLNKMVGFIITTQPEKATAYYRDALGFKFLGDDGFALAFDAHGSGLRVVKAKAHTPPQGTVLGWDVEDIRATIAELVQRGVVFQQFALPFMKQDEVGVWVTPNGDQVAWFKDPDGNTLSLTEHAPR